jgi:membrane protease YdiL (CAAX protease family)
MFISKLEEVSSKYCLDLAFPMSLVILAESLIFAEQMKAAIIVHALNLTFLVLSSIYTNNKIYPALMLLPLFRLLNVAMPVFFQLTLYSYSLVYAPMFIPIYFVLKEGLINRSRAGITFKDFWFYLPLAVTVGFALGWEEHNVLHAESLVPGSSIMYILALSVIMIMFVGLVEEFVFRSALQTVMEERLGSVAGLLATSVLFGFMHSGYHLPLEILFVSFAGIVFGLLFWMTRSLPIIALAHGITNVSLFLVAPVYPDYLIYLIGVPLLLFLLLASLQKRLPNRMDLKRFASGSGKEASQPVSKE